MMEVGFLVSIIIPVFNVEPFLGETLDSVLNQSYSNIEVIVINDGSTDRSAEICETYAKLDGRIQILTQDNKGLSSARNKGLDTATGDIIAFIDADDAYHHDFIKVMVETMKNTDSDIVCCKYKKCYTTEGLLNSTDTRNINYVFSKKELSRDEALRALADSLIDHHVWNKIYKKELLTNIRFPDGVVYEDIQTTYKIIGKCWKACVINYPLYYYRLRSGSIVNNICTKNVDDWLLAQEQFELYVRDNIPDIFSDSQLVNIQRIRLNEMIGYYLRMASIDKSQPSAYIDNYRLRIIDLGKRCGFLSLRTAAGFWMLFLCPEVLKKVYYMYYPIRQLYKRCDSKGRMQ